MSFWWILIAVIVIILLARKKESAPSRSPDVISINAIKNPLNNQEFDEILKKYEADLGEFGDDADLIEKLAKSLVDEFDLNRRLYSITSYLDDKFGYYNETNDLKWWPKDLARPKNLKSFGDMTIEMGTIKITYKISSSIPEYADPDPYGVGPEDYDRKITIEVLGKIVYSVSGTDYGKTNKPKGFPEHIYLKTFKPSNWLLQVHNWLAEVESKKESIDLAWEQSKKDLAAKRARERYSPDKS